MKRKILTLLMVSVMVASAFGAMGLSATKVGAAGEKLTLSSSNYNPSAGQQYTLSGLLTDGAGQPLANKQIDIFYHFPNGAWQHSNTIYTDANGKYSTTTTSSKTIILQTGYKVGGVYVASSKVVTINVQQQQASPKLTLTSTNYNPDSGQQYTLSGLLTDNAGKPLANKPIDIFYHFVNGAWQFSNTVYTGADGKYSTTTTSSKTLILQTGYKVGGVYVASSNVVTITTVSAKIPTTVTLTASTTSPSVGYDVTFTATLKAGSTPLAGKSVTIDVFGGGYVVTQTTDSMGQVNTSVTFLSLGPYSVVAKFTGDTTYGASTSQLTVTPINYKEQSYIWLTTDTTCWGYAPGGTVRVTATLAKSYEGTPITGAYVTIYEQESNGGALKVAAQGYTDAQGQLTTTRIVNVWGFAITYQAVFTETTSYLGSHDDEWVRGC